MKIIVIFSCSGMFRNVPEFSACSGMFHVPGFIDAHLEKLNSLETIKRRHNKNFVFHFVFYYSFDRKDGIQSGRR